MFGSNDNGNQTDNSGTGSEPSTAPTADPGSGGLNLPSPAPNPALPPSGNDPTLDELAATVNSPAADAPAPAPDPKPADTSDDLLDSKNSDLLQIKQEALQHLSPLVGHLEQSPEEKFRTLMMMIQASDDQSLIKEAYEAAENITDEKDRAQALLDIVNEINYFTQQKED